MEKSKTEEMTMEFIEQMRIASIPKRYKVCIGIFMAIMLVGNLYIAVIGIISHNHEKWVESGAFLLGNLLPITLIAFLVWVSNSGISALRAQSSSLLTKILPETIKQMVDYKQDAGERFVKGSSTNSKVNSLLETVTVKVIHDVNRSDADYIIEFSLDSIRLHDPGCKKKFNFRIELNVRRVNLALFFYQPLLNKKIGINDSIKIEDLLKILQHSLGGAQIGEKTNEKYKYSVNNVVDIHFINDKPYYRLVLTAFLADDILYSPREQLFFCQDLMYFLKSVFKEAPDLLESVEEKAIT